MEKRFELKVVFFKAQECIITNRCTENNTFMLHTLYNVNI